MRYEDVVADVGYESLENDLYLDATGQACFINPTSYGQEKSKKFKKQIGRIENMTYDPKDNCFTCTQGRKLTLRREYTEEKEGQLVSAAWYWCESCADCPMLPGERPGAAQTAVSAQDLLGKAG